jgi:hypothetical protein
MDFSNVIILEKYVRIALGTFDSRAIFRYDMIMTRCPVCGDSKSKSKKRGYILKNNPKNPGIWVYQCHNGDCAANDAISVVNLLKNYFPALHAQYRREITLNRGFQKQESAKPITQIEVMAPKEEYNEQEDTKHFVPILKGSGILFDKAVELCRSRKIDPDVWTKWFVAKDGRYKHRLIIPFYNNANMIYYYQGRSLDEELKPKYLNRKTNKDDGIYNYYNVDPEKPVCVLEGPIDSTFIKNSIAVLGLKYSEEVQKKLDLLQCYYLLDNDKDGLAKSKKFLTEGKYVFNWTKFLKDQNICVKIKDINDYVCLKDISSIEFEELKPYFTNSIFDKIYF